MVGLWPPRSVKGMASTLHRCWFSSARQKTKLLAKPSLAVRWITAKTNWRPSFDSAHRFAGVAACCSWPGMPTRLATQGRGVRFAPVRTDPDGRLLTVATGSFLASRLVDLAPRAVALGAWPLATTSGRRVAGAQDWRPAGTALTSGPAHRRMHSTANLRSIRNDSSQAITRVAAVEPVPPNAAWDPISPMRRRRTPTARCAAPALRGRCTVELHTGINALQSPSSQGPAGRLAAIMITSSSPGRHDDSALPHDEHLLIKPVLPKERRPMTTFNLGMC